MTLQERAYTSSIWYTPGKYFRKVANNDLINHKYFESGS